MKPKTVDFIFDNVFLPPNLPHTHHDESGAHDLLKEMVRAAQDFEHTFPDLSPENHAWAHLSRSLSKWVDIYDNGVPCSSTITASLQNMRKDGTYKHFKSTELLIPLIDVLLFYIEPQNAAIVVRNKSRGAIFECFEVHAKTEAVMQAKDGLTRHFPARAVFLPREKLASPSFTKELGAYIHKLSVEQLKIAMETTRKAKNVVVEERQSAHPRAVTEWLFGVLGSCGNPVTSEVFGKRVHDDVCWENTKLPWRRSGLWLCTRVALQIALSNTDLEGEGHQHYKNFMLFLLSRLARIVASLKTAPDVLHVLRVKLARRNAKLGGSTFEVVQRVVSETLAKIDESMQRQWVQVQKKDGVALSPVPSAEVSDQLLLTNCSAELQNIWSRAQKVFTYPSTTYTPPSFRRPRFAHDKLPRPENFQGAGDIVFTLVDFEFWIEQNLTSWLTSNVKDPSGPESLLGLMKKYFAVARPKYESHPERMSIMLLILFEMWVAVDTITTALYPLLSKYPPELPVTILEPLLVTKRAELERISRIELHIKSRESRCKTSRPSLFSNPSPKCFSVKYYHESTRLQQLRIELEKETQHLRDAKLREWEKKKREYDNLMAKVENMTCDQFTPRGTDEFGRPYVGKPRHHRKCKKCAKEKSAKAIEISKHEWALPEDEVACKAVIFELAAPAPIIFWRDATFFLLQDICRNQVSQGQPTKQSLLTYAPLKGHVQHYPDRRITLESSVKSMLSSHYIRSSLNVDPVLVKNGLIPRMSDSSHSALWTQEQTGQLSLQRYCNVKLSSCSAEHLAQYVNYTTHTTNSVIARQFKYLPDLSPHEAVLFGSLRSGEKLQWFNILGAVMSPELDLNSPATAALFCHSLFQVGAASTKAPLHLRESKIPLHDEHFSASLLNALESAFAEIEANFKEVSTAAILLKVSLKVLSMTSFASITSRCMDLVIRIRQAALAWIRQITQLRQDQKNTRVDSRVLKDLSRQILAACLLCRHSYDFDNEIRQSMFCDDSAVADYIESSIHLHTHRNSLVDDDHLATEVLNDAYLARRLGSFLEAEVLRNNSVLSSGVQRFWRTATFTGQWRTVHSKTCWMEGRTDSKVVHYNLVTGSLLVSGRAMSQLPSQYTENPLYRSLFADLEIDVFAADIPEMEYISKDEFNGQRVYFSMQHKALLIRACTNDETFEAVHRNKFDKDLPRAIVESSTPWMSLQDGRVVFRSREQPFCSSVSDWVLHPKIKPRVKASMETSQKYLVDANSRVGSSICNILRPIEEPDHLIITVTKDSTSTIEIELPRYHLHFWIDSLNGRMVCRELSAYVDLDQQLATMIGLKSRIILRANTEVAGSNMRTVLIPNGKVTVRPDSPHVRVEVQLPDDDSLTLSQYRIDARLGQLVSQDLEAHLYKAYLHAITSFPEADTLTGRTGTEESLFALSDPICRTCLPLTERSQTILQLISKLTPARQYYPVHLQTMQTATFIKELPVTSQRDIFYGTANDIVKHNLKASCLFEADVKPLTYPGNFDLLDRSHRRTQKLYATESVATSVHHVENTQYDSRDQDNGEMLHQSSMLAGLIDSWPTAFNLSTDLKSTILGWRQINGFHTESSFGTLSNLFDRSIKDLFAPLMNLCRSSRETKDGLIFMFSIIAFGQPELSKHLRTLLAFATHPALKDLPEPAHDSYDLTQGHCVNQREIMALLSQCEKAFNPSEASIDDESGDDDSEERMQFERELGEQRQLILQAVTASWPGEAVNLPGTRKTLSHFKVRDLKELLDGRFNVWYKNYVFLDRLKAYEQVLKEISNSWTGPRGPDLIQDFDNAEELRKPLTHFSLLDRMNLTVLLASDFSESKPTGLDRDLSQSLSQKLPQELLDSNQAMRSLEELEDIVVELLQDSSQSVRSYAEVLSSSIEASKTRLGRERPSKMAVPCAEVLASKLEASKKHLAYVLGRIRDLLAPIHPSQQGLVAARLWPQASELTLLQLLAAEHRNQVPFLWLPILLQFAKEITAFQRIERLQKAIAAGDTFALNNELANPAHSAWHPERRLDWLLLECQNNMLIRPVQIHVAEELLKAKNATILLGMGEGKTSVILPMVATALAGGSELVRIIVLKPLAQEMLRILSLSFAGLVGRSLYYLPFSRQTPLTAQTPRHLMNLYQECRQTKGILLTLPEYLNSFRLVGVDKLSDPDTRELATELIGVQQWLDSNSRDILDESDEICKPSYELVYTTGQASLLSGAPDRWNIALEILDLVQKNAKALHAKFPTAFEVESRGQGCFPHVRILNQVGANVMANLITQAISDGQVPTLSLGHCNPDVLEAVSAFILNMDVNEANLDLFMWHFKDSDKLGHLYIARGLISYQILSHVLGRRWKVHYGLDRTRTLSAVPYRAKATPSPSAEFAQPETAIVLTALSFYYTGLLRSDLRRCLLILLRLPDPADAYGKWVKNSGLPKKYHKVSSINLDDSSNLGELYNHLRLNSELISFFLRHVVYPAEAKEFKWKLSTSAWDLCRNGTGHTAGFSGTCDSRIPIDQQDLPDLRYIPATTLTTLLRLENRQYFCARSSSGGRLNTDDLLRHIIADGPISVIIDVGAHMLEGNFDIARSWLDLSPKKKLAVIYFSDNDEKMVLNRDGSTEALASSIFKDELGSCLIFLDQFHTRGTDFKLPDDFAAAVLLGPGILKDNLVQACMRMRKLAVSQQVRFYAPPEVDQSIRSILKLDDSAELTSFHVVQWAMHQSCLTLKKQGPMFATRGLLHSRRRLAASRHVSINGRIVNAERYLDTIRERECRPVSELYRVGRSTETELPFDPMFEEERDAVVQELLTDFNRTNVCDAQDTGLMQEQEREILHEIEEEREVERPREIDAATPRYSRALLDHIQRDTALIGSLGLHPCFKILEQTRLAFHYKVREFPMHVLVTEDCMRTIVTDKDASDDDFLRPVQWVLKTWSIKQPIIISSHEANAFLPSIRASQRTTLYMFQARVSRDMVPFDGFNICRIPENNRSGEITSMAAALIGLFAGQLYFSSFDQYKTTCSLIGLFDGERQLRKKRHVATDNFVSQRCREANDWMDCAFKTSPVTWLKAFIDMRRLGIEWSHTHMGRILNGQILRRQDFEEEAEDLSDSEDIANDMAELAIGEKEATTD